MRRTSPAAVSALVAAVLGWGCESELPEPGDDGGADEAAVEDSAADADGEADAEGDAEGDADPGDDGGEGVLDGDADVPPPCAPLATDYLPRESGSSTDDWPACISDDGTYHWIGTSIGTIARIASFEQIADLLWRRPTAPSAADFTDARVVYVDANGLDSRVQRREDLHYPEVPAADGACTDPGVPELYPDRCAGPARILPILNDAFAAGSTGADPLLNAARIEAALLWFLYLSPYKESYTCTTTPADCDSAWAYYTGGEDRAGGLGLSTYVPALNGETHDRIWDGLLAVRCWKNLDNETGVSTDTDLRDLARAQLDRAMLRAVALVVRDRLDAVAAAAADEARDAAWAFVQILGGVLDREATARDAAAAAVLRAELARADATAVDVPAAQAALDALFPCP
ncbi:MAG: hypothetical protein HY907_12525 [Deltaproteobacteria bacterium]|nr:hypothetical protein [Deltaproteobacteria bacterium]